MEAKNSMIQKLPFDTVKKILSYVPDRWNASQVCAVFYEVVAEIERNNFVLNLGNISNFNVRKINPDSFQRYFIFIFLV